VTPTDAYRDAMPIGGRKTIVREADGIHLNEAGAHLLAQIVLREVARGSGVLIINSEA
jgi:hypothetical protein